MTVLLFKYKLKKLSKFPNFVILYEIFHKEYA